MRLAAAGILALALAGTCSAGTSDLSRIVGMPVGCYPRIPGIYAGTQVPSGMYQDNPPAILLTDRMCDRMFADIAGRYAHTELRRTNRGIAWRTLGHEYAHSQGYDHGENTIGADCASYRYYMRPFMRAAGLPAAYANRLMRAVKRTGPCIPWR